MQLLTFASVARRPACRQGACIRGAQLHVLVNQPQPTAPCAANCPVCDLVVGAVFSVTLVCVGVINYVVVGVVVAALVDVIL